jgi:Golgi SNAP receptor complex protein 2
MTSIVELFPKSRKLAYDSRQQLSQVQNGLIYPSELFLSLDELSLQLDLMENLAQRELPAQREMWKRKILELREDAQSIRMQGEHYDRMVSAGIRQRRERDELLARRRNDRTVGGGGAADEMQQLTEEADSLENSRGMINELLETGANSLSSLIGQRSRMRWVNRKMLDIGNKLGLSNSTMRMIERRDATDAYLVFGGMIVTLLVIYFLYF